MNDYKNKKICKKCGIIGEDGIEFYSRTKLCITCFKQQSKDTYNKKKDVIKDKKTKKTEELVNSVKEIKELITEVKKDNDEVIKELKVMIIEVNKKNADLNQELQKIKSHLVQD